MGFPCTVDIVTPTTGWYKNNSVKKIYKVSSFLVGIYTGGKDVYNDVYNVDDKQPGGGNRLDGKESQV